MKAAAPLCAELPLNSHLVKRTFASISHCAAAYATDIVEESHGVEPHISLVARCTAPPARLAKQRGTEKNAIVTFARPIGCWRHHAARICHGALARSRARAFSRRSPSSKVKVQSTVGPNPNVVIPTFTFSKLSSNCHAYPRTNRPWNLFSVHRNVRG
jgi:hypothetical protein